MPAVFDSTSNLSLRPLTSELDVQKFLQDRDSLSNWLDFKTHFFKPLIELIEQNEQQWQTDTEFVRVGELLKYFSRFVVADNFQHFLSDWQDFPESVEWPAFRQKIRSEFEIDQFLQEKAGVWEYNLNQKNQLIDRIRALQGILESLLSPGEAEIDPKDEQLVREALLGIFSEIEKRSKQIDDILSRRAPELQLEEKTQTTLAAKLVELDENGSKAIQEQIATQATLYREKLGETLSEYKQKALSGSDDETRNETERIEQSRRLQNAPGKKGLVFGTLEYVRDRQLKVFQDLIVDFILRMVVVISVRGATQDTLDTVELLLTALEKLSEYLEKRYGEFVEEFNKKYDEEVQKILGVRSAPDETPYIDGGDAEQETPSVSPIPDLSDLVAIWDSVAQAWQESLTFVGLFNQDAQNEISEILARNSLRQETLESRDTRWEGIFGNLNEEQRKQSAHDAQQLLFLLDNLEREVEKQQEEREKPSDSTVVPLVTPTEAREQKQDEESVEAKKFREIGKISRDKATLDAIVEARLKDVLKERGLSDAQIEQQLALFRSSIASELWMKMLQEGILQDKLAFEKIIEIQTEFVAKYSTLILKSSQGINLQQIHADLQKYYEDNPNINRKALEDNFHPNKIKEILGYARELNTPEKRWKAVLEFSQRELGYTPDEEYVKFFIKLSSGITIAQTGYALDDLTQNLFQKSWDELTKSQQQLILDEIAHLQQSIGIVSVLFGLPDLLILQGQINQVLNFVALREDFVEQLRTQGQTQSATLFTSLSEYSDKAETGTPQETGPRVSAATQAIEISTTFAIIETLEISVEQKQIMSAIAIDRQLRGEVFGPAELGYLINVLQDQPGGFVDPGLQASLDPEVQKWRELQQNSPAEFEQNNAALHEQAAAAGNQGNSPNAQRQKLQMAMKLAKAAAGGPAAWAMLLADPNVRAAITKFVTDPKKMAPVLGAILAPPIAIGAALSSLIRDPLGTIGSVFSPGGTSVASVGLPAGLSEGLAEGGSAVQAGLGKELGSTLAKASESAASLGKSLPSTISNGITNLGLGKTFAVLAGVSFIGPLGLAGIITIIVITVIGASLNDLPFGYIRTSFYDGVVCWPTNGNYERGDEPGHLTSPNGSAMDISGTIGEPIYTPFSGIVARVGEEKGGYGYYADIRTDDGFNIIFAHMDGPSSLSQGARVEANTQVGFMGSTGNSTGPHLHYEIISTTLKITDIVPSQPPLVPGARISVDQCENFGTDGVGELIAISAGGGGYAYIFNDGYEFVTQADLSATKHVGVFGQANQLEAAINGNLYTPEAGTIDGIYTNGAGNAGYSLQPRPMETAALFLNVDSLPASTLQKLVVPSGNRVLYNQNGLVMLNIRGVGSSGDDERVIREEILPLVEHAVSGVPPIMINGAAQDMSDYPARDTGILRPRTIFGWRNGSNGREYGFIVVRDATFWDLDDVANEAGLTYAFALDGGNSSQLYVEGHDFSADGGWIDGGGGWHPEGGSRAVPVLFGIKPKN